MIAKNTGAYYAVEFYTPAGIYLGALEDFTHLSYSRVENAVTRLTVTAPNIPPEWIARNARIAVYRAAAGAPPRLEGDSVFFLRKSAEAANDVTIEGLSAWAIVGDQQTPGRIVAYAAGSTYAAKSGMRPDEMVKEIIRENLGSSATDTDRDLSSYLAVDADFDSDISTLSLSKGISYRQIGKVINEIFSDAGEQGERYFADIVVDGDPGGLLRFRVYKDIRGVDLDVIFSPDEGNIADPVLVRDWTRQATAAYAAGRGIESDRNVQEVEAAQGDIIDPFSRMEILVPAPGLKNDDSLQAEARAALDKRRPVFSFSGTVTDTAATRYGRDWRFGDRSPWSFSNYSGTGRIYGVSVDITPGGESVRGYFISESIDGVGV